MDGEASHMADYAVVVGVARYPELSAEGVVADLDGPNNDAQAVHDWLVDPEGGGLDPDNAKLIRSADFDWLDPLDAQPAAARIERELKWLERQTRDTAGGRLYLYFSGHGFSPVLEEGALLTAEATHISPTYVYAHAWLKWFRKAQRFREFVLWMDCCMNSQQFIPVNEVPMRVKIGTGDPGPTFVALAAQTKSAIEHTMPDGQVHGVFTWTLLKGLAGGASDERGRVTGPSLRAFLHNAMPEFFPEDAKRAASVDLQPFIRADEGIVFGRLPARPKHKVHLTIPTAVAGQSLKIWTGRPHTQVVSEALTGKEWTGALVRGLYVAEVSAAGLRHGFQVSGAGDVDIAVTQHGPAVLPSDGSDQFQLDVEADNPAAAITVSDHRFERVFTDTGELHERDAPGVYKVRVEFGRDVGTVSEEVLLLDRDLRGGRMAAPQLPSPAPLPESALAHEFHAESFSQAADRRGVFAAPTPGSAAISVIARYRTDPVEQRIQLAFPHPMEGLQLVDSNGRCVAPLSEHCRDDQAGSDPVAIWEHEVPPGAYFLRQTLQNGRILEGSVVACPNWITQVAIRRATTDVASDRDTAHVAAIGEIAVFMRAAQGMPRPADQDAVIEGARLALAQGRNLLAEGRGSQLQDLLLNKYEDPIAGIIGSHLLLLAMDADPNQDPARVELFDAAIHTLRGLVGAQHPDIAALSLRCADTALRTTQPFTVPPMFRHSWRLIIDASYHQPDLVPAQLWQRVHASTTVGPFFIWAADEDTRATHTQQLRRWIAQYAQTGEPLDMVRDAARRLPIPAAATSVLWRDALAQQPVDEPRHA
jgi:hypothetical protein